MVGQPFDPILFSNAIIVTNSKYYNKNITKGPKETIYQIENKVIKVMTATNIILDVFDVQ